MKSNAGSFIQLVLAGRRIRRQTKKAHGAGKVGLSVKTSGKTAESLRRNAKARVRAEVTYDLSGGDPRSQAVKLTLKMRG